MCLHANILYTDTINTLPETYTVFSIIFIPTQLYYWTINSSVSCATLCVHNLYIITFSWNILIILLTAKSVCSSSSCSFFLQPSFFFLCTTYSRLCCLLMLWKSGCLFHFTNLFLPWDNLVHILYNLFSPIHCALFSLRRLLVMQFLLSLYSLANFSTFYKNSICSVFAFVFWE